ncbi:hypothetical protein AAKU55_003927 [Oxalobacteraceae bacterium GrIS 1.11]
MKRTIAAFLLSLSFSVSASDSIIFSSLTEEKTDRWQHIDNKIAELLASSNDQKDIIYDYLKENNLNGSFSKLFSSKLLPLSLSKTKKYTFVRPSSKYTSPLYGAHTFSYWILDENKKIVRSSSVDEFRVLSTNKHGMRDVEEVNCFTNKCYVKLFEFDGSDYVQRSCRINSVSEDKPVDNC